MKTNHIKILGSAAFVSKCNGELFCSFFDCGCRDRLPEVRAELLQMFPNETDFCACWTTVNEPNKSIKTVNEKERIETERLICDYFRYEFSR